jgi:hypothetical protein
VDAERDATVWSSTWVPAPSPLPGFGGDGYAVCWVDLADGPRIQVLGCGGPLEPGTTGAVRRATFDGIVMELFERSEP